MANDACECNWAVQCPPDYPVPRVQPRVQVQLGELTLNTAPDVFGRTWTEICCAKDYWSAECVAPASQGVVSCGALPEPSMLLTLLLAVPVLYATTMRKR